MDDTKSYYQLIIKITISEEKKNSQVMKKGGKFALKYSQTGVNILRLPKKHKSKRAHTSLRLWMWLVDLNYIFECNWLIELSDNKLSNNKLSDNNLASELVENKTF